MGEISVLRRAASGLSVALLALVLTTSFAKNNHNNGHGKNAGYRQTNLVSDQPGVALLQDTNLVNAWGISFGAPTPFWVSDNGTGLATVYAVTNDPSGTVHVSKASLEVSIPGEGNPTGQVFNTTNFNGDLFLFVSEDGTISGWRPALGTAAEILATRSNAVYKGVTLIALGGEPLLLAANFSEGTVDVYDGGANLLRQLADTNAPSGYAPFNVQNVGGTVFVTFAKQATRTIRTTTTRMTTTTMATTTVILRAVANTSGRSG
jgi:uncharacterized protein (TIGR03118 family)